ncbi:helix-turn-helix transcriptional regulator [Halorubrum xinjiangense]|uniref:helix-turn-helix transcriptional regulator n=1 Tax=Halorubrum xinjiangense TaxID=261291 RepID=UPI003C6FAF9F
MADDGTDLRSVLAKREDILASLAESPARKPELVDELSVSRSTVDRAIGELTDVDCVVADGSTYSVTKTGRLALAERTEYVAGTDAIGRASGLLKHLPATAEISPAFLKGASVTRSEPHAPDRAAAASASLLTEATKMKGLAPTVLKSDVFTVDGELERDELTVEIVAERGVIDSLRSFPAAPTESLLGRESLSLYESETNLPYALWIMEAPAGDHAGITVHDSGGSVAGVIMTQSEPALRWANEQYREYKRKASCVAVAPE